MKKILLFASALAGLFLAGSCQKETLEPAAQGGVTYEITLPDGPQTKGENGYATYDLHYEVYKTADANALATAPLLFEKTVTMEGNTKTLTLDLLNDQDYTILFWANKQGEDYFDLTNLREVGVKQAASNNDDRDAFCGMDQLVQHDGAQSKTVELKRPFAQINIATLVPTVAEIGYDVTPLSSLVKVKNIPVKYNVFTGEPVGDEVEVDYTVNIIPTGDLTVNATAYKKVAMNYALVPATQDNSATVEVYYEINTVNGTVKNSIPNVPVKKNYRTNIIGNLLTSNATYTIQVVPGFEGDNAGHVNVINEGIVKNINGDYEVSSANGLAYAMNNLFVEGGDFYLTAPSYNLTGFNVTAPIIPTDVTLNIYGETPVVTRAATTFAGITIIGLPKVNGTPALIEAVENGGTVAVSGVTLQDESSVIVSDNQGTLVVSESEVGADSYVAGGNDPVEADNVKDIDTLVAALASDVKVIELAADIEATNIISISRSVTINGNGNTLYTSANRAIRIEKGGINLVINNLKIVSSSPSDNIYYLYGVSVNSGLSNSALTLNDCDIQFTYNTTLDNTYAVNVAGNGTGHKVTVNGGSYEGANVINVHGAKNVITVKNAVLNCLYPNNDMYYGSCIWVLQKQGSSVYAEGNTFNGNNAIAFNLGTGTTLEEKDNVDNTKMVVAKVGEAYYTSLAEAFAAAESGATVKVLQNTEMTPVTVASGKTITLDLNGKTVSNITTGTTNPQDAILVKGNLTVKNGTITTEHKGENLGWSAQSTVFNITAGGVVNLNAVTAKNLGGTDMGFVAHLNNWGEATFTAENCTLEANYVAVRVFNSGYDKNNVTIKNSTLEGGNYAFWVHNYTVADFGTPEKAIAQQKLLNFNLTEGNTFVGKNDTPIRLGMTDSMYLGADQIGNLPTYASVDSEETLIAALKNASTVNSIIYFANDITISNKWDNRYTGAKTSKPIEINGNGKTLKFTGLVEDMNYMSVFRFEDVATVKNLTIDLSEATNTGQMRAISSKSTLSVENCTFIGKSDVNSRGIIFGEGANPNFNFGVSIKNSTFTNWKRGITDNENGQDIKEVVIEGNTCTNAHVYVSAYESITFNNNILNNSCVNIRSYKSSKTVRITAKGNTLDSNLSDYNVIGHSSSKCDINNIDAQEGFIVYAE